ncbi:hypothetical protein RvY_06917 [Ramazzottius varieornatus]|uniref:Uncharacterized protein n=1 Tax=Ramazzottius varieornatus TaxID=947166 RepID=A0A1D1V0L9_RAMVA|nr:hypothetical protein RvY_06917 [Ramazzottius varieornatus]
MAETEQGGAKGTATTGVQQRCGWRFSTLPSAPGSVAPLPRRLYRSRHHQQHSLEHYDRFHRYQHHFPTRCWVHQLVSSTHFSG